jgi:hypothetical protein
MKRKQLDADAVANRRLAMLGIFLLIMAALCMIGDSARSKPPLKKAAVRAPAQYIVEPGLKCSAIKTRLRGWISKRLGSTNNWRWRKLVSKRLSAAIVKESKRHALDPLAMATVAWIESDYRPWLRGPYRGKSGTNRRAAEVGAFQLIPGDYPVKLSWRANAGCKPRQKWLLGRWRRYVKRYGTACHAPDVIKLRSRTGLWNRYELRDLRVDTYIAHWEMRWHLDRSFKRYPKTKWPRWSYAVRWRKRNPKANETLLSRYSYYNTGLRRVPRKAYRRKLLRRYPKIRDYVCGQKKIARKIR